MIKKLLKSTIAIGISISMMVPVQAFAVTNDAAIENNNTVFETNSETGSIANNYADIGTNEGYVGYNNATITTNDGMINGNYGTVETNTGSTENVSDWEEITSGIGINGGIVETNAGTIGINGGYVETNNGEILSNINPSVAGNPEIDHCVETNNGTIVLNAGIVDENSPEGVITQNTGSVAANAGEVTNHLLGEVTFSSTTGKVVNNYDDVIVPEDTIGTITNNFLPSLSADDVADSGQLIITNNYVDIPDSVVSLNRVTVQNQYNIVQFMDLGNKAQVVYTGFTPVTYFGENQCVKTHVNETPINISGTITITPLNGYQISTSGTVGENEKVGWRLNSNADGSYTITFDYLRNNLFVDAAYLKLIISAISQSTGISSDSEFLVAEDINNNTGFPVSVFVDTETNSDTDTLNTNGARDDTVFTIYSAISKSPGAGAYDIFLGEDPEFDSAIFGMICDGTSTYTFRFTHNGIKYILFIPKIDISSEKYKAFLSLLDQEPGGKAGPMKVAQLFSVLGLSSVTLSEEIKPEEPALPQTPSETNGDPAPTGGSPEPMKPEEQTHNTVMGAEVGMAALSAGNDFVGAATEGLSLASNIGADGVSSFAQMGGGSIRQETG